MPWNWQLPNWPHFIYDSARISTLEKKFLQGAGGTFAILKHLNENQKKQFIVQTLSIEGLKSAEIEGEILERKSLQSSIMRHFGLKPESNRILPKEEGMGDLMWSIYDTFDQPLTHRMLYKWHRLLMKGETKITDIGKYRSHEDPMQIVSGRYDQHRIFFEAPPSKKVYQEMTAFIKWFNESRENESTLARAAIVHVYFESIHPFEDGNGRIGRALVEKVLSQHLGKPTLNAISKTLARRKKEYYAALGACNHTMEVNNWLLFFAEIIVESQEESLDLIHFLMAKSKLLNDLKGQINERQEKVLLRMFSEGTNGFAGGLSAENYISITKTSRATATRDLNDLVKKGALRKTGTLRHVRYWLKL